MSETKHACCKSIMDGYHLVGCRKPVKVERDGRHYCTIHDPVRVAEKDKARSEKWEAERAHQRKVWALNAAAPDLLAALKEVSHHADDECGFMVSVRAAIAKAEGRQ